MTLKPFSKVVFSLIAASIAAWLTVLVIYTIDPKWSHSDSASPHQSQGIAESTH